MSRDPSTTDPAGPAAREDAGTPTAPTPPPPQDPPTILILIRHGTTPTTGQVLPGRAPGLHLSDAGHEQARRLAVFDVLTNNTDRKAGHVLRDADGRVWGIDHGLCFAAEPKLRTVIWDFAGEEIDERLLADVEPLTKEVPDDVARLLDAEEVTALRRRAARLVRLPYLPHPTSPYQYPWPLI